MRKNLHFKLLPVLCLVMLIFSSYVSDIDLTNVSKNAKIDQSLGLPIGEANLTIMDLFDKFGLSNNVNTTKEEISYLSTVSCEYKLESFSLTGELPVFIIA